MHSLVIYHKNSSVSVSHFLVLINALISRSESFITSLTLFSGPNHSAFYILKCRVKSTYLVPYSLVEGCLLSAGLNLDENAVSDSQVRLQLVQDHLQDQRQAKTVNKIISAPIWQYGLGQFFSSRGAKSSTTVFVYCHRINGICYRMSRVWTHLRRALDQIVLRVVSFDSPW